MLRQYTRAGRLPDRTRPLFVQFVYDARHLCTIFSHDDFYPGRQKGFYAFPRICYETRGRSGSFENTSRRRISIPRHTISANVQHYSRGTIKRIVVGSINVPDVTHIRRNWFVSPTVSAQKKTLRRSELRCSQEELFYSCF